MLSSSLRPSWGRLAARALVAGIVGGILIDAYLWLTTVLPEHGSLLAMWSFIASTAAGKAVAHDPNAPWIGLAIHAVVSIAWAGAYAYLAASRPFVNARWPISGIVYGVVVYIVMQIVLLVGGKFSPEGFANVLFAHAAFFGLPVALVVHAMSGRDR